MLRLFNQACMLLALLLGIVLGILGAAGLFFGANANFTLPPGLGVLPALFGWGIIVAVKTAWYRPSDRSAGRGASH